MYNLSTYSKSEGDKALAEVKAEAARSAGTACFYVIYMYYNFIMCIIRYVHIPLIW